MSSPFTFMLFPDQLSNAAKNTNNRSRNPGIFPHSFSSGIRAIVPAGSESKSRPSIPADPRPIVRSQKPRTFAVSETLSP